MTPGETVKASMQGLVAETPSPEFLRQANRASMSRQYTSSQARHPRRGQTGA